MRIERNGDSSRWAQLAQRRCVFFFATRQNWISAPGLRRPLRFTIPLHRCLCLQRVKWLPGHDSHMHSRFQRPLSYSLDDPAMAEG